MNGSLAQLEEHLVYTERVGSSNLSTPTNQKAALMAAFLVYIPCKLFFEIFGLNFRHQVFFKVICLSLVFKILNQ